MPVAGENVTNISFRGVYKHPVFETYEENGKVFVYLRGISSWYDLSYEKTEKGASLSGKDISIEVSGADLLLNKKKYAENCVAEKDGVLYVSVAEFAEIMGDSAEIKDGTVFIEEGEKK